MPDKQLTIIVPVYNEQESIGAVLAHLKEMYGGEADIIVVNDGSTDKTEEIIHRISSIRVISHKRNFGYGAALKTGILEASTELVCFFDGDGQHDAKDVRRLLDALGEADMVVASRGTKAFKNMVRAPGKLVLHIVANFIAGRKIPDLNSGLRLIRREIILRYLHLLPNGFSASTTSTMIMISRDYDVKYIPITPKERKGNSQVRQVRDGAATIMLIARIVLLFNPMKFFGLFGLIFLITGSVYGAYKLFQTGIGLSVGSLLILSVGIVSMLFGLICDQISHMRLEKYEKSEFIRHFQRDKSGDRDA